MTTYNTGNPIGSTDPRDLKDNAENFDHLSIGEQDTYDDRLGNPRRSWASIEKQAEQQEVEFNADQSYRAVAFQAAQDDREGVFNAYLVSAGYQFVGDYAAGIEITQYNQVVRDTSGEFWRVSGSTELPYTTTGAGMPEGGAFVDVGDGVLRQELGQGIRRVSNLQALKSVAGRFGGDVAYMACRTTAGDKGDGEFRWDASDLSTQVAQDTQSGIYVAPASDQTGASGAWVRLFRGAINSSWFGAVGDGVTDDTVAFNGAALMASSLSGHLYTPPGVYLIDTKLNGEDPATNGPGEYGGIKLRSNTRWDIASGARFKAKATTSGIYSMVRIIDESNIVINGGEFVGERYEHMGTDGEVGFCIFVRNSKDITLRDVVAREAWGDGLYIGTKGPSDPLTKSKRVSLYNCIFDDNRRQGVSVVGCDDFLVVGGTYSNTSGTAPEGGIDFEPNNPVKQKNGRVIGASFFNNRSGITLHDSSEILISGCNFLGNEYHLYFNGYVDVDVVGNFFGGSTGYAFIDSLSTSECNFRIKDNNFDAWGEYTGGLFYLRAPGPNRQVITNNDFVLGAINENVLASDGEILFRDNDIVVPASASEPASSVDKRLLLIGGTGVVEVSDNRFTNLSSVSGLNVTSSTGAYGVWRGSNYGDGVTIDSSVDGSDVQLKNIGVAAGASSILGFTIPGASVGDRVEFSVGVDLLGAVSSAYVREPNIVIISLYNPTSTSISYTGAEFRIKVTKPVY
jgi:parallel beta-helix repeat protein